MSERADLFQSLTPPVSSRATRKTGGLTLGRTGKQTDRHSRARRSVRSSRGTLRQEDGQKTNARDQMNRDYRGDYMKDRENRRMVGRKTDRQILWFIRK